MPWGDSCCSLGFSSVVGTRQTWGEEFRASMVGRQLGLQMWGSPKPGVRVTPKWLGCFPRRMAMSGVSGIWESGMGGGRCFLLLLTPALLLGPLWVWVTSNQLKAGFSEWASVPNRQACKPLPPLGPCCLWRELTQMSPDCAGSLQPEQLRGGWAPLKPFPLSTVNASGFGFSAHTPSQPPGPGLPSILSQGGPHRGADKEAISGSLVGALALWSALPPAPGVLRCPGESTIRGQHRDKIWDEREPRAQQTLKGCRQLPPSKCTSACLPGLLPSIRAYAPQASPTLDERRPRALRMESQTTCCHKLSGGLRGPAPLNPNLHPGGWQGPGLLHIQQVARSTLQGRPRPHPQNLQGTRCPPWDTAPAPQSLAPHGHWGELLGGLQVLSSAFWREAALPDPAEPSSAPLFFSSWELRASSRVPWLGPRASPLFIFFVGLSEQAEQKAAEFELLGQTEPDSATGSSHTMLCPWVSWGLLLSSPLDPSFNCSSIAMWLCLPWLHFSSLLFPIGRSPQSWPVVPPPRPAHFILSDTSSPSFTQAESL